MPELNTDTGAITGTSVPIMPYALLGPSGVGQLYVNVRSIAGDFTDQKGQVYHGGDILGGLYSLAADGVTQIPFLGLAPLAITVLPYGAAKQIYPSIPAPAELMATTAQADLKNSLQPVDPAVANAQMIALNAAQQKILTAAAAAQQATMIAMFGPLNPPVG
jgi:hypothetical protein